MRALPILMYHAVAELRGSLRSLGVPASLLDEHLHALISAGYRVTGLTEARDLARQGVPVVALTFDDAYADLLDALPILASYGASATLYVPVAHVGGRAEWLGARTGEVAPLLGWADLRAVADAGIEIGNHGLRHEPMDLMPATELHRQVSGARDRLRDRTGQRVLSFAYPHGYHTATVRTAVRAAGHDTGCEVGRRVSRADDDPYALPRLQPTPDLDAAHLLAAVRGRAALGPAVKRLAQPGWRLTRRLANAAGVRLT